MKRYIIPFTLVLLALFLPDLGINQFLAYGIKVVVGLGAIIYFWKQYKEVKMKFDIASWAFGFLVMAAWFSLEFLNTGNTAGYDPTVFTNGLFYLVVLSKVIGMVVVAAVIEELFMRSFLIRLLIKPKWEKVKIGTFTLLSFLSTTIIFGMFHGTSFVGSRLVAGLVAGAMFNIWLYYKKDIFACIQCHASANLFLVIITLATQNWMLW